MPPYAGRRSISCLSAVDASVEHGRAYGGEGYRVARLERCGLVVAGCGGCGKDRSAEVGPAAGNALSTGQTAPGFCRPAGDDIEYVEVDDHLAIGGNPFGGIEPKRRSEHRESAQHLGPSRFQP